MGDSRTGTQNWEYAFVRNASSYYFLDTRIAVSPDQATAYIAAPAQENDDDGHTIAPAKLHAVDTATGKARFVFDWPLSPGHDRTSGTYEMGPPSFNMIGDVAYLVFNNDVHALDAHDGTVLWNYTSALPPSPVDAASVKFRSSAPAFDAASGILYARANRDAAYDNADELVVALLVA